LFYQTLIPKQPSFNKKVAYEAILYKTQLIDEAELYQMGHTHQKIAEPFEYYLVKIWIGLTGQDRYLEYICTLYICLTKSVIV